MKIALQDEFEYYVKNQDEFVKDHSGKFIVIKDKKLIGVYDDELTAVKETSKSHKPGTFLVQKCEPGNESYTQTYHTRAAFV